MGPPEPQEGPPRVRSPMCSFVEHMSSGTCPRKGPGPFPRWPDLKTQLCQ